MSEVLAAKRKQREAPKKSENINFESMCCTFRSNFCKNPEYTTAMDIMPTIRPSKLEKKIKN